MGLKLDIQSDLIKAFNTDLVDAVKTFTLRHTTGTTYDPVTGTNVSTIVDYTSRGVFSGYEIEERVNSSIRNTDVKLILVQSEISIEPEVSDEVVQGTKEFEIVGMMSDPADATYELQLRSGTAD